MGPAQPDAQTIPTPPGTQRVQNPDYPQSEQGNTPPLITSPPIHEEATPLTPLTPINYPKTAMNTPIPRHLPKLDIGTPMELVPDDNQETPTVVQRTQTNILTAASQQTTPVTNRLGQTEQHKTPPTPPTKMSLFDRLEEAANGQANSKKHPAHNTIEKYHPGPMPPIQDTTPTSLFDNIDLALIREWDACPGGKLITVPFNPDVRNIDSHDFYRTRILTAVMEIIMTQEASVASSRPSQEAAMSRPCRVLVCSA